MMPAQHLNSLGYVVGGSQNRPYIGFGFDNDGARVSIADAVRGAKQGLRCECHCLLVAKKGDIKAHHFAHKAGDTRHCEAASRAAILTFISDALLDGGEVALPLTAGRIGHAKVHAVVQQRVSELSAHVLDAQKDRKLLVFVRVRRQSLADLKHWCRANDLSGMAIDLTAHRNRDDDEIAAAIRHVAPREWLYRSERNDRTAPYGFLRRLYGLRG